ncbi:MAG TPA: tripartite tricarboxylate transporter substrate binding protein [Steroidobacteraceae bacterium]|nr:tripartite tricarboxylate transporter substrate binding protein [Steroidobacteraceae bacterium]
MIRRQLLRFCATGALVWRAPAVWAQAYPAKPIRLIVAYPPGGQSDLIARLVAQALGSVLGVSVVVENRPGANGAVGVEFAARAPADGYTVLLGSGGNLTLGPAVDSGLRYDPQRDFIPIARIARVPLVLAARADLPVASLPDLIAYARKHPGKLTYASGATLTQIAIEALKVSAGVDMVYVPYKGSAQAMLDVAAGRVDFGLADVAVVTPHVQSGAVRLLANSGAVRARAFPAVPTAMEQGVADFVWESWHGLLAPAGTPAGAIGTLQEAMRRALDSTAFRESLANLGFDPIDEDPKTFAAFLRDETALYRRLVSRTGLHVER